MEIIRNGQGNNHREDLPHLWSGHQRVEKRSAADKLTWKYILYIILKYILYIIQNISLANIAYKMYHMKIYHIKIYTFETI